VLAGVRRPLRRTSRAAAAAAAVSVAQLFVPASDDCSIFHVVA